MVVRVLLGTIARMLPPHAPGTGSAPMRGVAPTSSDLAELFAGQSVLLTGHTGFKGSWLSMWLHALGARVSGYALDPPTTPSLYELAGVGELVASDVRADLRDATALRDLIDAARPSVVFHLAAQSVVRTGYAEPVETFSVNVVGTAVLLDAIRSAGLRCAVVVVSSDKCYANHEDGRPFTEADPLGGHDPYSASKAGTELVADAYRASYFPPDRLAEHGVALATARAGNVLGGGDWTPDGIAADFVRSVRRGEPIRLRYPDAVRPWQHVLDPLAGYLSLAAHLLGPDAAAVSRAYNFGPSPDGLATVRELTERFIAGWGAGEWIDGRRSDEPAEAGMLRLDASRAAADLGWQPRWDLADTVDRTIGWYRSLAADPGAARSSSLADLESFLSSPASVR